MSPTRRSVLIGGGALGLGMMSTAATGAETATDPLNSVSAGVYLDGDEAVAFDASGELARSTTHGGVIQTAIDAVDTPDGRVVIGPGDYSASDVAPLTTAAEDVVIEAWGAVIDTGFYKQHSGVSVHGLAIDRGGAAGHGFHLRRGRGAFIKCVARNLGGVPWLLGGESGAQVSQSVFQRCEARQGEHGFVLDGRHSNSWVNANTFIGCDSKSNQQRGLVLKGNATVNTFIGMDIESNDFAEEGHHGTYIDSVETAIYGGLLGGGQTEGASICFGENANGTYLGGPRIPDGLEHENGNQAWFGYANDPGAISALPSTSVHGDMDLNSAWVNNLAGFYIADRNGDGSRWNMWEHSDTGDFVFRWGGREVLVLKREGDVLVPNGELIEA